MSSTRGETRERGAGDEFKERFDKYRAFLHDVTAAILVSQNNETAVILVSQNNKTAAMLLSLPLYVKV